MESSPKRNLRHSPFIQNSNFAASKSASHSPAQADRPASPLAILRTPSTSAARKDCCSVTVHFERRNRRPAMPTTITNHSPASIDRQRRRSALETKSRSARQGRQQSATGSTASPQQSGRATTHARLALHHTRDNATPSTDAACTWAAKTLASAQQSKEHRSLRLQSLQAASEARFVAHSKSVR